MTQNKLLYVYGIFYCFFFIAGNTARSGTPDFNKVPDGTNKLILVSTDAFNIIQCPLSKFGITNFIFQIH